MGTPCSRPEGSPRLKSRTPAGRRVRESELRCVAILIAKYEFSTDLEVYSDSTLTTGRQQTVGLHFKKFARRGASAGAASRRPDLLHAPLALGLFERLRSNTTRARKRKVTSFKSRARISRQEAPRLIVPNCNQKARRDVVLIVRAPVLPRPRFESERGTPATGLDRASGPAHKRREVAISVAHDSRRNIRARGRVH